MASIVKQKGRACWYASYRDAKGKQHLKTTGIEHSPEPQGEYNLEDPEDVKRQKQERGQLWAANKRAAIEYASRVEETERGNPTEAQLRKLVADMSERLNQQKVEFPSVSTYLTEWLKKRNLSAGTRPRYEKAFRSFLSSLESRKDLPINAITAKDFNEFAAGRMKDGLSPSTVVCDLKALNVPFASAMRQGLILSNPVAAADPIDGAMESRKPFTANEVEALLKVAGTDWQTAILFAAFAGLRLGDAVNLTWGNLNLFEKTLTFRPKKNTRKKLELTVPLCERLMNHLLTLPKGKDSDPICPTLAGLTSAGKSGLSMRFNRLMKQAKIKQTAIQSKGKGRSFRAKTFHSLRHFFITRLEEAGVAPDIRQKLAGHSTDKAHSRYTHTELSTLRKAVAGI